MLALRAPFVILLVGSVLIPLACSVEPTFTKKDGGGSGGSGGSGGAAGMGGAAACMTDTDCGDAEACFSWKCTDQKCAKLSATAGVACSAEGCDDGDLCTEDVCGPDGLPSHKPLSTIDDKNICTIDQCDPKTGAITYTAEMNPLDCGPCSKCDGAGTCKDVCLESGKMCKNGYCF